MVDVADQGITDLQDHEKAYQDELIRTAEARLGPDWRESWPAETGDAFPKWAIMEMGTYSSVRGLVDRAKEEYAGRPAVCFIEHPTVAWAVVVGAAWNIDPDFFVDHVRPLSDDDVEHSLRDCRAPNSNDGLVSSCRQKWATMRGFVDWGKPKKELTDSELTDSTHRRHHEGPDGVRQSHTNMSFYRVHADLYIILIDQIPDYQHLFLFKDRHWFPNQAMVRIAMLESPGYVTIPQLAYTRLTAVFPIWTLFEDKAHKDILIRCLTNNDIDGFLYKATFFYAERECGRLWMEVKSLIDMQATGDAVAAKERLMGVQKGLFRLKGSIVENRENETRVRRAVGIATPTTRARNEFHKLAVRFLEIDASMAHLHNRQVMMTTTATIQESLLQAAAMTKQAQSSFEMAQSSIPWSWLAIAYVPLTIVTGIFAMNVRSIKHRPPMSWTLPAVLAWGVPALIPVMARVYQARRQASAKAATAITAPSGQGQDDQA